MTNEQLLMEWTAGKSAGEIAAKYGVTARNVYARIYYLRKRGVRVPEHPKGRRADKRIDVESLNVLLETLKQYPEES